MTTINDTINTNTTAKSVYTAGTYSGSWLAAKIAANDLAQALDRTMKENPKAAAVGTAAAGAATALLIESLL